MRIVLNSEEAQVLFQQRRESKDDGGFQRLIVSLQEKFDPASSTLDLSESDIQRISKYAFDFGRGGFETRLQKVFGRHLGPKLDGRSRPN